MTEHERQGEGPYVTTEQGYEKETEVRRVNREWEI